MYLRPAFPRFLLICAAIAAVLAACNGDDGDKTPTATAIGATAVPSPSVDIRTLDLTQVVDVQALLEDTEGVFAQENVIYDDVNGDGIDEAIVPIASGGTGADIGFIVLTPSDGGTRTLLTHVPQGEGLAIEVQDGKIVTTEPAPGPDDPLCCPSFLRKTTFNWNGAALALESSETIPNPGAFNKTPGAIPDATSTPRPPGSAP
jgi:hypothetical protein